MLTSQSRGSVRSKSRRSSNESSAKSKDAESELMEVVLKANKACEDGKFMQAIHLYSEGLRIEPGNAMVFSNRSAAYLHSKDYVSALKDAERTIKLQPTWSKGYLRKGLALQHLHKYEDSVSCLAQGLAYETQSRQILSAVVESTLLSQLRDSFDGTQRQLRKLGLDQNPFVMLSAIGQELLSAGKFKIALTVLNCAEQINTANLRLKGSLMSALASAHWKLGNQKQAMSYMEEDLSICRSLEDQHGECRVIGNLGNACYTTKLYEDAIQYHKDQLLLATDIKSRRTAALALGSLGHTYSAIGEHGQALACHEQCLALAKEMGNKICEAEEYGNIGCLYLAQGDHATALKYHELHLSLAQELDNVPQQTKAYFNMATLYQQIQDYSEALKCYQELLTSAVQTKDRVVEMRAYAGMGACTKQVGELTTSLTYYEQHLSIALKVPDNTAISKAYCSIGNLNQTLGRLPEALEAHKNHLVKVLELRDRPAEGRVYGNLGNVHCAMGHFNKAIKLHEQALAIAIEVGDTTSQGSTNGNLGIAYQGLDDEQAALRHLDAHLTISRECEDPEGQLKALSNLGNFHAAKSDYATANDLFQEQLDISTDRGDAETQCKALTSIGMLYRLQGKLHTALTFALQAVSLSAAKPRLLVKSLLSLAKLHFLRGEYQDAQKSLQRAYDITTQTDTQHGVVLNELAIASLYCGYTETALSLYNTLSDLAQEQKAFNFDMMSLSGYGQLCLEHGSYSRANDYFQSTISMCKENSAIKDEFHQHLFISRVYCAQHQYEDAHSALVSAKELLPRKSTLNQEDKNFIGELCEGFGDLSLAKGDYEDALEHYKEETTLLVGEDQIKHTQNMVLCLWSLGSGYQALQILYSLEENTPADSPYLAAALLDLRAKLYCNIGCFTDAIHQQELRLDLARRQVDRVFELAVLNDLGKTYLYEGHFDQALVNFDQTLMISRDLDHTLGQCKGLVGLARAYFNLGDYDASLNMCDQIDEINKNFNKLLCESYLVRARSYLELGDTKQSIKYSRLCSESATFYPLLLAAATAILGHGLIDAKDEVGGHEALISSCSQFEISLLQKSIDFVYEQITPLQELSYSMLFDLQPKPADNIMVYERILRWERGKYLPPSAPFPALHTSTKFLSDMCGVLGEGNVCVLVRVDQQILHTWYITHGQGLTDYYRTAISDKSEFLASDNVTEAMFGCVVGDVKRYLGERSTLYVVLAEDIVSQDIIHQLKNHYFPKAFVSICGCMDDIGRFLHDKRNEKSITPAVLDTHRQLNLTSQTIHGKRYESYDDMRSYHTVHLSCEMLSYSQLNPELVFVGDVAAECVVLHNTGEMIYEDVSRLSVCLLSNVRCIVAQLYDSEDLLDFYKDFHYNLTQGDTVFSAVGRAAKLLADPHCIQCYGCDWLPRIPDHVTGVRLLLRSAHEISPAVRATLEIIDKIKTGFNREGPITIQYDILEPVLGWDEVLLSLGATIVQDKVTFTEAPPADTDHVRTLLTSLLDCGEGLCAVAVGFLYTSKLSVITHVVDLLDLYLASTPDNNSPAPQLPLPADVYNTASSLLQAIGLWGNTQTVSSNGSVLLSMSNDTSLLRVEAALYVLKTLFDLGSAETPYGSRDDNVGVIEI